MNIYIPFSLEGYELCHPLDPSEFENIILQVNGVPRRAAWQPIAVEIIHKDEGNLLLESDSPWLGSHALVFRRTTISAMKDLVEKAGELLPLRCLEAELSIFNPTQILDALDISASSVLRFGDGRIMRVSRYAFRSEVINGIPIFKIPDLRASPTFVNDEFVSAWSAAGLRGLGFKRV